MRISTTHAISSFTAALEQRALEAKNQRVNITAHILAHFDDIDNSSTEGLHAPHTPVQKPLAENGRDTDVGGAEKLGPNRVNLQQVQRFQKTSMTREPVKPGAKKKHDSRSSSQRILPIHDQPLFIPSSSRNGSAPSTPDLTSPKCSTELRGLAPQDKLIHKQSGDPEILNSRHSKPPPRSPRQSLDEILTLGKRLTSRPQSIKPAPRQVPPPLRPGHSSLGDTSARSLPDKNTLDLEMELQQDSLTKEAHQQQQLPKKEHVLLRKKMAQSDVKKSRLEGVCHQPEESNEIQRHLKNKIMQMQQREDSMRNKIERLHGERKEAEAKMKEEQYQLRQELEAKNHALKEKEEAEVVRKKELHEQRKIRADLEAKLKEADQALESKAQMEADLRGQLVQREQTLQHHSQGLQDYQQKKKEWAAKESDLLQELALKF